MVAINVASPTHRAQPAQEAAPRLDNVRSVLCVVGLAHGPLPVEVPNPQHAAARFVERLGAHEDQIEVELGGVHLCGGGLGGRVGGR